MEKIIVTGANGQLGNCIKKISEKYSWEYDFVFLDSKELDITDESSIEESFSDHKPTYLINAAAYTAVDLAESNEEKAYQVNTYGVENLAVACKKYDATLIHVSTDYVFDGESGISYTEDNFTNPQGIYGASKLKGEELALEANPKTIIIRTSWLYSEFNKNFVKTMLNLFSQKEEIGVVGDQFGQPTNANDLAEAIIKIISSDKKKYGVYHFSNYPETTWWEFASKIAEFSNSSIKINKLSTEQYPTAAKRPQRSTMDNTKIQEDYDIEGIHWEHSLEECISLLKN